jgi:hypothetical protein
MAAFGAQHLHCKLHTTATIQNTTQMIAAHPRCLAGCQPWLQIVSTQRQSALRPAAARGSGLPR